MAVWTLLLVLLAAGGPSHAQEELSYEIYPPLPVGKRAGEPGTVNVVNVCIVASEFSGIVPNGGIGTFYSTLAETLANAGHQVTLLYTQGQRSHHAVHGYSYWVEHYQRKGIKLVPLNFWRPQSTGYHSGTAFMVYDWLRQRRFDVVHFPDWQGHGYYSLLAKHLGLDFHRTTMCCMVHGPLYWARTSNSHTLDTPEDIETDFLERGSIRTAEVLISPSHYLINWIGNQTWQLPEFPGAIRTQPYILPHEAKRVLAAVNGQSGLVTRGLWERSEVTELCFFGRLEVRKGIVLFADVLDSLLKLNETAPADESVLPARLKVTFLGSDRNDILGTPSRQYIMRRAIPWGAAVETTIHTDKDSAAALTFLKGPGRIAVMPSLIENSPLSILELMGAGIPFVASTAGGIPELIREDFRPKVLFKPVMADMLAKLSEVFREGALVPSPHYNMDQVERNWVDFHVSEATKHVTARALQAEARERGEASGSGACVMGDSAESCRAPQGDPGAVASVVVVTRGGGAALQATVLSVLQQEEVLGDWGGPQVRQLLIVCTSTSPTSLEAAVGTYLAGKWAAAGGEWLSNPEATTMSGARNAALQKLTGSLVVYIDAGCLLETFGIKSMLKVHWQTGASAITSFAKFHKGELSSTSSAAEMKVTPGAEQWFQVYLGGSASMGLFRNIFGGPVVLFAVAALREMGGYKDLPTGYDHWELLSRWSLAERTHEVIPQVLAWVPTTSMNGIAVRDYNQNRYWKAAVLPLAEAKLWGFDGASWRTKQSVSDAFQVISKFLQVDLAQEDVLRVWMGQGPEDQAS
mmetsp:Transcript_7494/g.21198  ORF Transcript_7494/g.21198 Transcript_7494/m.21198 type:complete len:807 (+) Transcript_7494:211-2631(+)|eukprot:CAMPEP_0117651864 /NCGR_PEP_ID=MMETSP0804-20121206/2320_1 /TAXON_ID=1074897 /ORGANISM="Tetraselmis astigmatica, Strain CCMP880" /LENGTH=806 /DNA_ID=CAMNT_0005457871 /DNA_START=168 /DNA_END=2588 /DNA_ORIENTATION=-